MRGGAGICHRRPQKGLTTVRASSSGAADAVSTTRSLGRSRLTTSTVGIGTLQWGDERSGFNKSYRAKDLELAFKASVEEGVRFFDTAEVYGYSQHKTLQSSEILLGDFGRESPEPVTIGSKCFTIPWTNLLVGGSPRLGSKSLVEALKASVERVGRPLDLW